MLPLAWAALVAAARIPGPADAALADAARFVPDAVIDLRYATASNFLGRAVYPPGARCLLLRPVAERLSRAADRLRARGLRLRAVRLLPAARRPARDVAAHASQAGSSPIPRSGSNHNRGAAVDVGLVRPGRLGVELPTAFDAFGPRARAGATAGVSADRAPQPRSLRAAMEAEGFRVNPMEWWHFDAPEARRGAAPRRAARAVTPTANDRALAALATLPPAGAAPGRAAAPARRPRRRRSPTSTPGASTTPRPSGSTGRSSRRSARARSAARAARSSRQRREARHPRRLRARARSPRGAAARAPRRRRSPRCSSPAARPAARRGARRARACSTRLRRRRAPRGGGRGSLAASGRGSGSPGSTLAPLAARAARARLAPPRRRRATCGAPTRSRAPGPPPTSSSRTRPSCATRRSRPRRRRAPRRASGLSRQADLSAHLAPVALRHAPVAALVLAARARRLALRAPLVRRRAGPRRLRRSGSARARPAASPPRSTPARGLGGGGGGAAGGGGRRCRSTSSPTASSPRSPRRELLAAPGASRRRGAGAAPARCALGDVCDVRFGMKTRLQRVLPPRPARRAAATARRSLGEVALGATDVVPLLASLKEARAPERAQPARVLFRPERPHGGRARVRRRGRGGRRPPSAPPAPAGGTWWRLAPGRGAGAGPLPGQGGRARLRLPERGGALGGQEVARPLPARHRPPGCSRSSSPPRPVRLAIDEGARQLTGRAGHRRRRLPRARRGARPGAGGARRGSRGRSPRSGPRSRSDPVTTDLAAMLARPAQRELDLAVGRALRPVAPRGGPRAAPRSSTASRRASRMARRCGPRSPGSAIHRAGSKSRAARFWVDGAPTPLLSCPRRGSWTCSSRCSSPPRPRRHPR